MKIVGVGCGPGMLTEAAIQTIQSAHLIIGSERALDLAWEYLPETAEVRTIENYKKLRTLPDNAVILSTGDPMISGLGYLGGEIVPGISSAQLGAAKAGVMLTNLFLITAHGRDYDSAITDCCEMISTNRKVCIIADPSFPINKLARMLSLINPDTQIIVCENLGYQDERITYGTAGTPPAPNSDIFILFIIKAT